MTNYLAKSDYNNALYTIDPQVLGIEKGNSFRTSHKFTDVANNTSKSIYIKTGNYVVAGKAKYYVTENTEIHFYEDAIIDVSGNPLSLVNYNRNSSNTGSVVLYHTPTIDTSGNEILNANIFVASSGLPIDSSAASAEEDTFWLLKPNTNYLIQVWNRSGGDASTIYIDLRAREEPNYVEI